MKYGGCVEGRGRERRESRRIYIYMYRMSEGGPFEVEG